jgi:hypothetical protein
MGAGNNSFIHKCVLSKMCFLASLLEDTRSNRWNVKGRVLISVVVCLFTNEMADTIFAVHIIGGEGFA